METISYTVVRNETCLTSQLAMLEGHNDRRSVNPMNADIVQERTAMNVYYHRNFTPNGEVETYHQTIDRLLAEKKIVKHNFKPKSAIVDEFVLDVNSEYFERNGGYEFAKKFYEEAYRYAVKEAGSENYIVSAVLHADERNKELSERLGRDVYHYHLHVVYVPVVEKEIKWTKRAGPELVGKVKEVIPQINHTDKWPRKKSGRGFINEYSKLQDRYHAHMTAAGYADLVRGERGSTAEHLDVLDFKIQQDNRRLADLDNQVKKKEARSEKLDDQIAIKEKAKATLAEVNAMGHGLPLVPGVHLTDDEAKRLKALAKKGVGVDKRADEYKKKITELEGDVRALSGQVDEWKRSYSAVARDREAHKQNYNRLWAEVKDFIPAIRSAPQALLAVAKEHNAHKNKEASR